MKIALDFRNDTPLYEQITAQIRQRIAVGVLEAGEQLPTIRELASELDINFNTVARSYRILDAEGLISTQHGRGTFILGSSEDRDLPKSRQENLTHLIQTYLSEGLNLGYTIEELKMSFLEHLSKLEEE